MRLLYIFLLSLLLSCNPKTSPKVIQGIIDLRNWNLQQDGTVELVGDWEFYWEKFLNPDDFLEKTNTLSDEKEFSDKYEKPIPFYITNPRTWKGFQMNGRTLPGHGYATYRMKILLDKIPNEKLALRIKDQAHAYKLFLNGELVVESGKVGDSFENMKPDLHPVLYAFTSDKPQLELIFHVSNFYHRVGGLRYEIKIGTEKELNLAREQKFVLDSFLFGGFFIIALYHSAIFLFRPKSKTPLFFAIFCISILFHSMVVGDRFLYYYFPDICNWDMSYKLEFLSLCFINASILSFTATLYPFDKKGSKLIYKFLLPIPILYGIFINLTKPVMFTEYLYVLDFCNIFGGLFIITQIVLAVKNKKDGSRFFLFGFLILFLCAILDIMSSRSIIVIPRLIKFGLTTMVLMQAILLAKIFTGDFLKSEILSNSLSQTNRAYSRFIPTEFLNLLEKKSILDINLGDHTQKEMTILFSDIRSFTSLSEKMTPTENFQFLNSYLNRIAPIIKANHGFIDKYIGDAIMGLFPDNSDDALLASIAMQKEIQEYNLERERMEKIPIKVGIGLHTGSLILGTIGHDERMEGTVISDAVNLASRLEGLTKHYGSNILISENTFSSLEDPTRYHFRLLDNVLVKGKADSIFVIEILDGFPDDLLTKFMDTKKDFETGNLLYKQKAFEASITFFKKVLEANPLDTATAFYLKRAEYYNAHGAPPDWEGGEVFLDK